MIGNRKADHIRINLEEDVASGLTTGLEHYHFLHQALPELDLGRVDTSLVLLGKRLAAPLLISSMTGGTPRARDINLSLARVAQTHGIAMAVGSQRMALEQPETADTFRVRSVAPDILLLANLGAVQLNYGYGLDECRRAVDMIEADALVLHVNPLQEALQPEGEANMAGLLHKIEAICRQLPVPVIAKEVGWGISESVAGSLRQAGVAAIDVAGAGGTSWSQVELHRTSDPVKARVAAAFRNWGIPTAESIRAVRRAVDLPIIASGGLRDGLDVAKCIALGACACGLAAPFLKAVSQGPEAANALLVELLSTLRIAMFCAGAGSLPALHETPLKINN
ncbi:MAG: type 2 isopentenyl-diphosphate Delta-isomerase [Thermoflexales bacterium]|nr:type 2 isopentenyl-diphosphate Delta-isomerase [Thermoflexales bacterium]